jgi:hypothetical protein
VEWPRAPGAPLICVVGDDPVGESLISMSDRSGGGVRVRRLDSVAPGSGCSVVYAAGSGRQTVSQALEAVATEPVLTVTDARRSNVRGIIHFTVQQDRVRFYIDSGQARRNRLGISSKLLALALEVKR